MIFNQSGETTATSGYVKLLWCRNRIRHEQLTCQLAIEFSKFCRTSAPAEVFLSESDGSLRELLAEAGIRAKLFDCLADSGGIGIVEYVSILAVMNDSPEIGARQNHRATNREEFRKFGGKSIIVKGIRSAGLHEEISQGHDIREVMVMWNLAQGENMLSYIGREVLKEIDSI